MVKDENDIQLCFSRSISWTIIDDEVFVFEEVMGNVYLIKGLLKDFWIMLSNNVKYKEIVNRLTLKYQKENDEIEKILSNKLEKYIKESIIVKDRNCETKKII